MQFAALGVLGDLAHPEVGQFVFTASDGEVHRHQGQVPDAEPVVRQASGWAGFSVLNAAAVHRCRRGAGAAAVEAADRGEPGG